MQDKTEGKFFLQRLRTPSAGSDPPPSGFSRIWASPAHHLWHYFFHFRPLVQILGCGPTIGFPWSSSAPPSFGRDRVAPQPTCQSIFTLSLFFILNVKQGSCEYQLFKYFGLTRQGNLCQV